MEDKTFELMEKMYIEFNKKFDKIDQRFDKIDQRFDKIDQRFDSVESDVRGVKKDILRLENELTPKVEVALDGYKLVYEKLTTLEDKVDIISSKLEKQDVEIRVIKGAK